MNFDPVSPTISDLNDSQIGIFFMIHFIDLSSFDEADLFLFGNK
jgi:hypothetical protein